MTTTEIPAWMDDRVLDVLGGREHVEEVLAVAANPSRTFAMYGFTPAKMHYDDIVGKLELLDRLHRDGVLA